MVTPPLITATWYTIEEQPIRIGWWSTFLGIANAFGGLLEHEHSPCRRYGTYNDELILP
jgi:hypothetical protein